MYAVIKTGGKQYRVAANDKITIEKLEGEPGEFIHFTDVLMVADGAKVELGAPFVSGATVVGEIASQDKSPTVYIFKKRRRKHYRRRNGHRQLLTSVTITDILTGGAKPTQKAAEAKPKAVAAPAAPKPKAAAPKPEPVKAAEPVRAMESVRAATPATSHIIETVRSETHVKDDGSHIIATVKGEVKQGGTRVEHAVQGGHRVEEVHLKDTDHSHIIGTVKGETKTDTTVTTRKAEVGTTTTVTATTTAQPLKAASPDDISLIGGIGPKIEKQLREKGVNTWAQIAAWTPADVERYNTELKLMGRIAREEWIEQAKELMAGKPPRAKTDKARKE